MNAQLLYRTLELARSRRGYCAPNPSVGAVIACGDEILAEGFHYGVGHAHAEVEALKQLTDIPADATLYVSLEPCCHHGRTPPCTDAIIASGIKRVVYGFQDPNPVVSGGGQSLLQAAGIHCELVELPEITEFYRSYAYWTKTRRPWVTAKLAMSLDGKIASASGEPIILTGPELKNLTFLHRKHSDAILTTAATIIADDPQMNVRLGQSVEYKPIFLLDRNLRTPLSANIFKRTGHPVPSRHPGVGQDQVPSRHPGAGQDPVPSRHPGVGQDPETITVYHSTNTDAKVKARFIEHGIRCVQIAETEFGLDLTEVINDIGHQGIHDLWLESGSTCYQAMINQKLVQKALLYVAPKLVGPGLPAFNGTESWFDKVSKRVLHRHGDDVIYEFLFAEG